jgi:hypothetical protein
VARSSGDSDSDAGEDKRVRVRRRRRRVRPEPGDAQFSGIAREGRGEGEVSMAIQPWFVDWLRERTRHVVGALRGDVPTWGEIVDRHGADAAGLLYTLLEVSAGRRQFDMGTDDLLALLVMDRSRFNEIVAVFVQRKIIAATTFASGEVTWTILRQPEGWVA